MALDACFTRRYDRLETKRFAVVGACMGFSHGELSNGETQKVEPYVSLICFQGMGEPRFARFFTSNPMSFNHATMICCALTTSAS